MNRDQTYLTIMLLEAIFIAVLFIGVILVTTAVQKINDANLGIIDIVNRTGDLYRSTNTKIDRLLDAHNQEVHSWYIGNKYIQATTQGIFDAMHTATENSTMLDDFNDCVEQITYPYMMSAPHLGSNDVADGYMIWLYDKNTIKYIGHIIFAKTFAEYQTTSCGSVYYNVSTEELTYDVSTLRIQMDMDSNIDL